jgi:anti-anti-sigma factor
MKLPTEIFGEVVVVHTPEELTDDNAVQFEQFVTSQERFKVIVELDATESIDSAGLTSLISAQEALREVHGDLKISTTNKLNRKILELTRIDQQLEVFESVIDAVKSFV